MYLFSHFFENSLKGSHSFLFFAKKRIIMNLAEIDLIEPETIPTNCEFIKGTNYKI